MHLPPLDHLPRRWSGALLRILLTALILVALAALWWLTWQHEQTRVQEATEQAAANAASEVHQRLATDLQLLQQLLWLDGKPQSWRAQGRELLREHRELMRIEQRDRQFQLTEVEESSYHPAQFQDIARSEMSLDAEAACTTARRFATPAFSRSYFLPTGGGLGLEVVDLCLPRQQGGQPAGALVATLVLSDLLQSAVPAAIVRSHEVLLTESDGTRLARAGTGRGAGVYTAERLVDIAGLTLPLRLDSIAGAPRLIANPTMVVVVGLSLALTLVLVLLLLDVRRRETAEQGLAEALAFRKAMEDALVTGLRARDLRGRITYVNPAFCEMVGFSAAQMQGTDTPPYWPPELLDEYRRRLAVRMAGDTPPREGFETIFMRQNGERFPVLIFEAPLVDGLGRQTGWMSTVLDVSAQRRIEELSRLQQDKLHAAARLATMGEMATLLSHELNQPLAAIASYATGSLNLLPATADEPPADLDTQLMIRHATARVAEQAERAGRIIRSVHQFVRRRDRLRESVRCDELIEAILPLVRLAARRSHTRIELDIPKPAPRVSCDRTMVEQVLLNLARNAIQAMEDDTPAAECVLQLRVRPLEGRWIEFAVTDGGPGIPAEVAAQIFTPFFSTKPEGMGIGLAMCRTVVEQHGGVLAFTSPVGAHGTEFRFTLEAAASAPAPPMSHSPSLPA
jgi:two-component system sensor histidine kinase DctS